MPRALQYCLAQTWTADLYWASQRGAPARAASPGRHTRPPGRRYCFRRLPAFAAIMRGGGSAQ
jgi:hypothetical protein